MFPFFMKVPGHVTFARMWFFISQTSHKKTFFYLEQLILKHNAHNNTVRIKQESGMGI